MRTATMTYNRNETIDGAFKGVYTVIFSNGDSIKTYTLSEALKSLKKNK